MNEFLLLYMQISSNATVDKVDMARGIFRGSMRRLIWKHKRIALLHSPVSPSAVRIAPAMDPASIWAKSGDGNVAVSFYYINELKITLFDTSSSTIIGSTFSDSSDDETVKTDRIVDGYVLYSCLLKLSNISSYPPEKGATTADDAIFIDDASWSAFTKWVKSG
jgi:hypothetical protein